MNNSEFDKLFGITPLHPEFVCRIGDYKWYWKIWFKMIEWFKGVS